MGRQYEVLWRIIEHGEKPTIHFVSLGQRSYVIKTVNKFMQSNGGSITHQSDILSEIENFIKICTPVVVTNYIM